MSQPVSAFSAAPRPRYLESVQSRLTFPESADVPESLLHLELRTLLYQLLKDHLGLECTVGSDQFVYYDAADPTRSLAPDVYVQKRKQSDWVRSWKVWERGAPELAVEILSESDAPELAWNVKLERYRSLGIRELVRFDARAEAAPPLRIWHRVQDDLLEREIESLPCPSLVLPLHWVVAPADGHPRALRIATGESGKPLVLTRREARDAESQRAQQEAQRAQQEAQRAQQERAGREDAEARVRELERLLEQRSRQ
jgi:Uma2 family endonuclease